MGGPAGAVFGRDEETSFLEAFLDAVADLPGAVVIEGEAGIGKTTLLETGVAAARRRGYRVLRCGPAPAETRLSLSGLRDLLESCSEEVMPALPEPQRRALAVALLIEQPGDPDHSDAVPAALLGALRLLAASGPVLVAIDDVQWLDASTQALLSFALRRLRDEPIGVVLARRLGGGDFAPLGRAWGAPAGVQRLEVGPVRRGALHALVGERLGAFLPRPVLGRIHEASGGNPFVALEMARALGRHKMPAPGDPLPVPESLRDLLGERLSALSRGARYLVAAAAASPHQSASTLARLFGSRAALARWLGEAERAGVLSLERDSVRFTHPLLAAVAYSALTESERRGLHRRLAASVSDSEATARHLALAAEGPDALVAGALDDAAAAALARGAPIAAAEMLEMGRRLTPPSDAAGVRRRTLDLARSLFLAGDTAGATALLEEVAAASGDGALRAEASNVLARIRIFTDSVQSAVDHFRTAVGERSARIPDRIEAEEGLAWSLMITRADLPAAAAHARRAAALADELGDRAAVAEALAAQGAAEFLLARPRALALVQEAVSAAAEHVYPRVIRHPRWTLGVVQVWSDDLDAALKTFGSLHESAIQRGDESSLTRLRFAISFVHLLRGDWVAAESFARLGTEVAMQSGQRPQTGMLLASRAVVDAHRGDLDAVRARVPDGASGDVGRMIDALALGLAELSAGNPCAAHACLEPVVARMRSAGVREPGTMRFVPDDIEALMAMGRVDEAGDLLGFFESAALKAGRASGVAAALRCRGLLLAQRGDLGGGVRALERATVAAETLGQPFDHARTLLCLGTVLRRAKRRAAAREVLEWCRDIFASLGAGQWVSRAEEERGRIGGRASSGTELTPTEKHVAQLVAEGLSNAEVAASLFVTRKTVEGHLSRIYTKLGIRSRTALAHVLSTSDSRSARKV